MLELWQVGPCLATTATEAAIMVSNPWSWVQLRHKIAAMQPGDQLVVEGKHTVIRLSGKVHRA